MLRVDLVTLFGPPQLDPQHPQQRIYFYDKLRIVVELAANDAVIDALSIGPHGASLDRKTVDALLDELLDPEERSEELNKAHVYTGAHNVEMHFFQRIFLNYQFVGTALQSAHVQRTQQEP
jgi:hypothetical protein